MTELNGRWVRVVATTTNTFQALDQVDGSNINSTSYGTYVSGGTAARVYEIATPYAEADLFRVKFVQSADVLTLVHPDYVVQELRRSGATSWALSNATTGPGIDAPAGLAVVPTTAGASFLRGDAYVVTSIKDNAESSASAAVTAVNNLSAANTYNRSRCTDC
jgi:hypothetical protein